MSFIALLVVCACFSGGTYADLQERISARSSEPLMCNGNEDLCSLKFNQVTFAGTHNSGSGFCGPLRSLSGRFNVPCFSRNQDLNFTEQLQYGIRSFDIDLCYIEQASARFSPAGPWTCHISEYGGAVEKALMQIDEWMQLNPYEVIAINFNEDFDQSLSDVIGPDLHALLEALWDPTPERISDGNLTMNTNYNETLEWPTLRNAIETNQRIFIFMFESLWLGGKPWIHVRPTGTVGPIVDDDCSLLVENSRRNCNLCVDLVQLDFYGAFGHCIFDMARICSFKMYNGSQACYNERIQFGKTVNFLHVDFPNRATSPFTVVEVTETMNALNINYYNSGPITTQQPPPSSCLPDPIPQPQPTPLPPITSTCEALQRIATNPLGYFQCQANIDGGCDRLVCPSDLMDTNGTSLFQLEVVIRSCDSLPAFQVILKNPTGNPLVSVTTNQSSTIDFLGPPIDITLDQLQNAIGLQLQSSNVRGNEVTLIEYTIIPIDTTTCRSSAGRMVPPTCATELAVMLLFCILVLFPF